MSPENGESLCPVCGFDLGYQAWEGAEASLEICPSCGIQFGYDEAAGGDPARRVAAHRAWRERWLSAGCPWTSKGKPPPAGWNGREQVERSSPHRQG